MAYRPDDDRFYDSVTGAGAEYVRRRDKVAEDQAATTRQVGQMYANVLPGMVDGAMKGADWRMKRAKDQQALDVGASDEERKAAGEGRSVTKFAEDQEDRAKALEAEESKAAWQQSPADKAYAAAAGVNYQDGMTNADVARMIQANEAGYKGKALTSEEARAKASLESADKLARLREGGENMRAGNTITFNREKLASDAANDAAKLAADKIPKPKPPPAEMVGNLGESESAELALQGLAKEWNDKASGKFAGVTQYFGGTDAARYGDAARTNAQVIGKFLEGGKMTDNDIPRYEGMLPTAGDSAERAKEKLDRLSLMVAQKKKAQVDALNATGYDTGSLKATGKGSKFNIGGEYKDDKTALAAPLAPKKQIEDMTDAEVAAEYAARKGKK